MKKIRLISLILTIYIMHDVKSYHAELWNMYKHKVDE